jgi:hypothetical protein
MMATRSGEPMLEEDARRHSLRETYAALLDDGVPPSAHSEMAAALLRGVEVPCAGLLSRRRST